MKEDLLKDFENNVIARREATGEKRFYNECNKCWVSGVVEKEFEYSHKSMWEKFYRTRVIVKRLSGTIDYVPIIVSDTLLTSVMKKDIKGKLIEVAGQFRSYVIFDDDVKSHMELNLFVTAISIKECEEELEDFLNSNLIYLEGEVVKPPIYRLRSSERQITDLYIAVQRSYNKKDYLTCLAWGRTALLANQLNVGEKVRLYGRIQSRLKPKKDVEETNKEEYNYEVSILRFDIVNQD